MRRILVESSYGTVWRDLLEGISLFVQAQAAPWQLHYANTADLLPAITRDVDGVLCLIMPAQTDLVASLRRVRPPVVNMVRNLAPHIPSVLTDHALTGERAADYFLARGYTQFAFLGVDRTWSEGRLKGFSRRLAARRRTFSHLELPMKSIGATALGDASTLRRLRTWIRSLTGPVALFACADYMARLAVDAARLEKRSIPDDLAILGVDNDKVLCELASVPLSSIPQNFSRIGFEAARLLHGLMTSRRKPRSALLIPPREIVVRRSTDAIAVHHDEKIAAALRCIHESDPKRLSMKLLVDTVGVSRQWLDRRFKELLGRTPSEEIRQRRLEEVRKLLLQTRLPISEIARRCGFSQAENLARSFSDWTGLSPREYRNRHGALDL